MRHGFDCRGNLETAEVCTAEYIASVRRGRDQTNVNWNGSVQSYSLSFDGTAERGLFDQMPGPL